MRVLEESIIYRNTFLAVVECEWCNYEERDVFGKDTHDWYFRVLPEMECNACGQSSNSGERENK